MYTQSPVYLVSGYVITTLHCIPYHTILLSVAVLSAVQDDRGGQPLSGMCFIQWVVHSFYRKWSNVYLFLF